eukprot:gnl/TRDRNA2_/TRDRNA2_58529_c0_seq2.p1 gnl/TRDRNA2_/TRDRNA2_58529_c0~~gnl/TRDRNA2_/TRDRNA2_58529_c0_seq2.p1  ORF type:complete len:206 (+),score=33.96 gnl/TRDRNA2_/TRDRNA2_58529_c0_seq2:269-886(+)
MLRTKLQRPSLTPGLRQTSHSSTPLASVPPLSDFSRWSPRLRGAVAQEESLARASGLYPTLTRHMGMYGHVRKGLYSDRMIYSPGVPVFRDDAGALLHEPFLCDVVSAAACNLRAVNKRDAACLDETMRRRTRKILSLAQARGVNCIVLGAWGTGVFRMDPADVAEWFEEALHEVYFDEVVFAIPDARKLSLFEAAFAAARSSRC